MGQPGFFDLGERYRGLDAKKDPLVVLNAVVPWEDFRARLSAVWRKPDEERKTAAVLSGLAPASITCAFGRAATSRHAASRMASTVTARRRNWSLRQSAGTCWW